MAILSNLLVRIGVDADRVEQQLGRVGGFFRRHGAKIAAAAGALGTAGAVALVQGLQAGMEKEALGDKLAAQLGATGPEAARLGKIAGNVYSQGLGEGLDQVHDAVGAVVSSIDGMQNASNSAVQAMTVKALNLAKAFEVDVNRSMQVVGQIVKSGLVKDANQGLDLLTASMQKVPSAVREDLVDALDEYSPFMQQIGIKGKSAFNLLVQSAEKGAFGLDKTGDALKEFVIRATDMSDSTKGAYKAIGVSQKQMTKDILAGGKRGAAAFQKIITGLRKIKDPTKQSQAALALFGTQLEDIGLDNIPKFLSQLDTTKDHLGKTAGAADQLGKTLNENASTGIESWKRKTDAALASLVNTDGIMGDTAQAATGITQSLAPVGQSLGGLALTALVAGRTISGVGGRMMSGFSRVGGAALRMGGQVASASGRAAVAFLSASARVIAAAARMVLSMAVTVVRVVAGWVLMGVQALLGAAKVALAWLIALGPIGIVIAAIIGLVALVVIFWDQIKGYISAGWNWIKNKTVQIWNLIVNFIRNHWQMILAVILGPLGVIVGLVIKNWGKIKAFTSQAWNAIKSILSNAWHSAKNIVVNGIRGVVSLVRGLPGRIRSALGNLGHLLVQAGRNVVQGLINGITSRFGALAAKASELASKIRNFLPFSPAKEGPLSGRGNPQRAGQKIATMVASGMARKTGAVASAAAGMASAASVNPPTPGVAGANAFAPSGVAAASGGALPPIVIKGDGSHMANALIELLRAAIAESGGDVQRVLGRA